MMLPGAPQWLLEIDALDGSDAPVTLRFSRGLYRAAEIYIDRLREPVTYHAGAMGCPVWRGGQAGFGDAVLTNIDGGLDWLADYAIDGRPLRSLRVTAAGVQTVARGTALMPRWDGDDIIIPVREPLFALNQPHPHQVFAGDNVLPAGVEGTEADLQGKRKPRCRGAARNVTAVLVNSAINVWQVHDLEDGAITAARVAGVALSDLGEQASLAALLASSPTGSQYTRWHGYMKLGSVPTGALTADYDCTLTAAGDVFEEIANEAGYDVSAASVTALNALGDVGWQDADSTPSTIDMLGRITAAGAYWTLNSDGELVADLVAAPGAPVVTIRERHRFDISREALFAGESGAPVWRLVLDADPVSVVQRDLAGSADAALAARVGSEYRSAVYESAATLARHKTATELRLATVLRSLASAQARADALGPLLAAGCHRTTVEAWLDDDSLAALSIGVTVRLITPKLGYSAGRDMIVIDSTVDGDRNRATLELWG
ncbi:hypothetical protein JN531_012775 [Flagellatimonas centrodinii]|uniref:hypothetical protein n=1 Tax=Flagellatimonas centrodinii TaxID=2806210 RepID=UPI001FEE3C5D|nr:hypothetical protein [Flagellatimonas centrodinii]ULQ45974.1 hypothetical protein JN531_012775 [Flagellatimonas centrodinii]